MTGINAQLLDAGGGQVTTFRAIERPRLAEPHPARIAAGPAPQLAWLDIARLVVSPEYQRPITSAGKVNIKRIADHFQWSRFSPVIVAPVEGGLFAIIDGQHRTTAAASIGIEAVPCQVVLASPGEQAQAFTAINSAVTRVTRMALHKASVAAGDPVAAAIERVAARAGVTVLAYPKSELNQEPGETMAIGALSDAIRIYGEEAVVVGLRLVRETGNNVKGGLIAPIVSACCALAARKLAQGAEPDKLIAFAGGLVLFREYDKARLTERAKGVAIWSILLARLEAAWTAKQR